MIDFKSMKKVQDDKDMAVLQHEKGHQVKIIKSALSPMLQKQLAKLPLHQAKAKEPVQDADETTAMPGVAGVAKGQESSFEAGGPESGAPDTTGTDPGHTYESMEQPDHNTLHDLGQRVWNSLTNPAPGAASPYIQKAMDFLSTPVSPDTAAKGDPIGAAMEAPGQGEATTSAAKEAPQPESPASPAAASPTPAPTMPQNAMSAFNAVPGYKEQAAGAAGTSKALQEAGQARAKLEEDAAQVEAHERTLLRQSLAEKQQTIDQVTKEMMDNRIDPNHYLANRSVPQKVATAIGLILGGISSGQTGQPNPALTFLNKQIENDLEAQRSNMAQKHNVLSALERQYGNTMVAENMFRAIRANTLAHQIDAAAATSQSALAKAAGQNAIGQLKQQYLPLVQKTAILDQLSGKGQPGGASQIRPARQILLHEKIGNITPEEAKEANIQLDSAQKTFTAHHLVDSITDQIVAEQTSAKRLGSPIQSTQRINALRAQLIPLILEAEPSKRLTKDVLSDEVDPLVAKFTSNSGTSETFKEGLHNIINAHASGTSALDGKGIPYPKYTGNPRTVRGADGKDYVRSPDGRHMIPVTR